MRTLYTFLITALLVSTTLFYSSCTKDSTTPNTQSNSGNAPTTPSAQKLLDLVNKARTEGHTCGSTTYPPVSEVTWSSMLESAAQKHSDYMNSTNELSHTGENNSSAGDRITGEGYKWVSYGENIAEGYTSEEEVVVAWLQSEGHCKNIMSNDFREMGVATNGRFWTQVFGSR